MKLYGCLLFIALTASAAAQGLRCDMSEYKPAEGLTAQAESGGIQFAWHGERNQQLTAAFS